jgi:glyoxylate/hydroxypyruvate reductase A
MAVLFRSSSVDNAQRWREALAREMPDLAFRVWPEIGDPADIEFALVWRPQPGLLASLPNLRLIASLGAGVDHILADPDLPRHVPLVRLVDPYMTVAMSEYVLMQVLRLHRQEPDYAAQQRAGTWRELPQPNASERRVGMLGLGALGCDAALKLRALGFDVAGWSRSPKSVEGVASFQGADGLAPFLARSEILVCLLPLTPQTENILNRATFEHLPRGAALVNAARGRHLAEPDLIPALESGQLSWAVLDVFRDEPLPAGHPFWRHERILMTPHVAAATNPPTAAPIVAATFRRCREGRPLLNVVDYDAGY